MKKMLLPTFLVFLIFNSTFIHGQGKKALGIENVDVDFYLNGVLIDLDKVYLNPTNAKSIDTRKTSEKFSCYFITNKNISFYTLKDISNKYVRKYVTIKELNDPIVYRIKNQLIEDTTSVRIDDSFYIYVGIEHLSKVKYIPGKLKNLTVVNINLEDKEREPEIRIRGTQEILDKFKPQ